MKKMAIVLGIVLCVVPLIVGIAFTSTGYGSFFSGLFTGTGGILGAVVGLCLLYIAFQLLLAVLLPFAILFAEKLVNDPTEPEKAHYFTTIEQGQLKAVVRGTNPVGYIMFMPDRILRGVRDSLPITDANYAVVENRRATDNADDLFAWSSLTFLWWRKIVYKYTGCIFVGIHPFQKLYQYPFEPKRIEHVVQADGTEKLKISTRSSTDAKYSDHVRVREFDRAWMVGDVEVQSGPKVTLYGECLLRVVNPFLTLFGVTRYERRVDSLVSTRLNECVSAMPLGEVLTRTDQTKRKIEEYMVGGIDSSGTPFEGILASTLRDWGIEIVRFHLMEVEDKLSEPEKIALSAEWVAQRNKAARVLEGEGDAGYLEAIGQKLTGDPALARIYERIEVAKAASAGGNSTIVMEGGGGNNRTDALLIELIEQMKKRSGGQ